MVTGCQTCGRLFNDEHRYILCPHGPLTHPLDDYCPKCDTLKSVHGLCKHQMGIKEMRVDQEITEDGEIIEDPQPEPEGTRNNFPSDPSYVTHIDVAVIQGDVELQRDRMESATSLILQSPGLHIKQGKIGQALEATLIMAMEFLQREFSTNLPNVSEGPAIILGVNPDDPEAPKIAPHYSERWGHTPQHLHEHPECPGTGEEIHLYEGLPECRNEFPILGDDGEVSNTLICALVDGHAGRHQALGGYSWGPHPKEIPCDAKHIDDIGRRWECHLRKGHPGHHASKDFQHVWETPAPLDFAPEKIEVTPRIYNTLCLDIGVEDGSKLRCDRLKGHSGDHNSGIFFWPNLRKEPDNVDKPERKPDH